MFITALFTMPKYQNNPKGSMKNKLMNGRQKCGISIQGNVILHRKYQSMDIFYYINES